MTDDAIAALIDKEALRDLAARYCRAIDRRDMELLRSVYHPDATDEHGTVFSGAASDFADRVCAIMDGYALTAHYICTSSYRLDGDEAEGELYFLAYHRTNDAVPRHALVTGRYLDRYRRRDGAWRIAHRRLVWDAVATHDVRPEDGALLTSLGAVGGFDDDLSYEALPRLGRGR